jgi:hypothetical protein
MELTKLSASAMGVAENCLSRYQADLLAGRNGSISSIPAMVGSACHGAMENFVKFCVMEKKYAHSWATLEIFYMQAFMEVFQTADCEGPEWEDGKALLKRWFARTVFGGFTVLSCEQKLNFKVPTSIGEIPFNYILDRLDQLSETEFRVMDYKTLQQPLSPMDLHDKIQARVYGLAVQIMYPQATRVWVGFDMLRWESAVETSFTRDQNIETWRRIKRACERIIAQDPQNVPETLNSECGWCIKKTTCSAAQANIRAGGVLSYNDLNEMINARALLKMQAKAATDATKELDKHILAQMGEMGVTTIQTDIIQAAAVSRGERSIDPEHVRKIAGQGLFEKYGEVKMTLKQLDDLLADPDLPGDARARIEALITKEYGSPYLSTKEKK